MGNIILNTNTSKLICSEYKQTLRFLRWLYTDERAKVVIENGGYYLPSSNQIKDIVHYLDSITCNGEILLEVTSKENPKAGKIAITTFFWIIILISTFLLTIINYTKPVSKIYAVILIIGLLLCGSSMILWTLTPTSDEICSARWWLMGLGMSTFSGGVFCRSYQLKKIHHLIKNGRFQKTKTFDHIRLLTICMGFIVFIEMVLLLILEVIIPFKSNKAIFDVVNREGEYHCSNDYTYVWIGTLSGYLVCILILGIYSLYTTWRISSAVDDTRINILMIFLCLVALILSGVIWYYSGKKEDSDSWWALSLITFWGLSMMCSVFIPKFVKSKKSTDTSSLKAVTERNYE